ncbi:MAG: hypothetical protein R2711_08985 [Acidimicrobiales bacterium]
MASGRSASRRARRWSTTRATSPRIVDVWDPERFRARFDVAVPEHLRADLHHA